MTRSVKPWPVFQEGKVDFDTRIRIGGFSEEKLLVLSPLGSSLYTRYCSCPAGGEVESLRRIQVTTIDIQMSPINVPTPAVCTPPAVVADWTARTFCQNR